MTPAPAKKRGRKAKMINVFNYLSAPFLGGGVLGGAPDHHERITLMRLSALGAAFNGPYPLRTPIAERSEYFVRQFGISL